MRSEALCTESAQSFEMHKQRVELLLAHGDLRNYRGWIAGLKHKMRLNSG